jgi:hypothetical protein
MYRRAFGQSRSFLACMLAGLAAGCGGGGDAGDGHDHSADADAQVSALPGLFDDAESAEYAGCQPVPHAATELRLLNRFWSSNVRLCMATNGRTAYAVRSQNTVYVNQDWLDAVARRFGSFAATGILAHEWGHIVQGNVPSGTAAELQADCLAGVHLRWGGVSQAKFNQFAASNFYAGDPTFRLDGHGTGAQRVRAAQRGYAMFQGQTYRELTSTVCPLSAYY